jgi:hypothetical protein
MTIMLESAKIFSYIPTKNFERAKAFYGGVLGLNHVSTDDFALVFESGGIRIRVVRVPDFKPGPIAILGWRVDDLEKSVTALKAHGVICEATFFQYRLSSAAGRPRLCGNQTATKPLFPSVRLDSSSVHHVYCQLFV